MKLIIITILFLLGACASLTEDQLFEREYALQEARHVFIRNQTACKSIGGSMVIIYRGVKSSRGPSKRDYEAARCLVR